MQRDNHPIEQEELMAYLDGELATGRAAAAATHLERCRDCQSLAADLQGLSRKLMAWQIPSSEPPVTPDIAAALEGRGRAQRNASAPGRRSRQELPGTRRLSLWVWGLAGVSLVLLLALIPSLYMNREAPHPIDSASFSRSSSSSHYEPTTPASGLQTAAEKAEVGDLVIANGPLIVRTAQITLTAREFDNARAGMEDVLKRHHGYFGELNVSNPVGAGRTLTATLRVPADQLDATMAELKKLGRVESESQSGEEVTQQYVDLQARLSNARNTEQRLLDLLGQRTGKLADVLAVELEIGRVRGEIERMEAERKGLANRVDFATLNATLTEDYKAQLQMMPDSTASRFRNAAVEGYRTMTEGVVSVALFLVSVGPSLLLWAGLLFFPARAVWRRLRRRPGLE